MSRQTFKATPLTPRQEAVVEGVILGGGGLARAAIALEAVGRKLSKRTLEYIIAQNPKLKERLADARESVAEKIEETFINKALEGNIVACIFALKNLRGWSDRRDINVDGKVVHEHVLTALVERSYELEEAHGHTLPGTSPRRLPTANAHGDVVDANAC